MIRKILCNSLAGTLIVLNCSSCEPKILTSDQIEIRGDLSYETGDDLPFTGEVKYWEDPDIRVEVYDNGYLFSEIVLRKGQKKSEDRYDMKGNVIASIEWYNDDQMESETPFKNNEIDGIVKEWDRKGKLFKETTFVQGKKEGLEKIWSGDSLYETNYKKDIKHGESRQYTDGNLSEVIPYQNGEVHGTTISFFENGDKYNEHQYINGKLHGYYKEWYSNGKLKHEYHFEQGKRNGLCTEWGKKGNVLSKKTFRKGELYGTKPNELFTGTDETFFPDGRKQTESQYKNGKLDGLSVSWSIGRTYCKLWEVNYRAGLKHGKATRYSYNGQKNLEEYYEDGKRSGISTRWHLKSGNKKSEESYENDKLNGFCSYWSEDGSFEGKALYKNDKFIKKVQ